MKTRKSIRLLDYDYSQSGEYFITICVNNSLNRLSKISECKNILSIEGEIDNKWILKLTERFNNIFIDCFIIMPNHIHFLIEIKLSESVDLYNLKLPARNETDYETWRVARTKMLLPKVINYLKTNASIEINRRNNEIGNKFWQANYYEHIVRNEKAHLKISSYIENNPSTWDEDRFNLM
jgi:putative transposase